MGCCVTWPCAALERAPLGPRTTLGVGGTAAWLLEPATPEELRAAVIAAREQGWPVRVLGAGANLLVDDGEHRVVVIGTERLRRLFRPPQDALRERGAELFRSIDPQAELSSGGREALERDPRLIAWCGMSLPGLVSKSAELGLSGFEGLVGVPGHVGGGLAMNAGGRWGELWDQVESALLIDEHGEFVELRREQHTPAYRDGRLGGRIVAGAVLRLEPKPVSEVKQLTREYLRQKKDAQPLSERSAGCVFQNPPPDAADGRSAGQLLDAAGCKGLRRGDATVSSKHANFLVNAGAATSADVHRLIADMRSAVEQRFGIELHQEVKAWRCTGPEPIS
jgi:UDP-N-acetylmuramate dehydrogenase